MPLPGSNRTAMCIPAHGCAQWLVGGHSWRPSTCEVSAPQLINRGLYFVIRGGDVPPDVPFGSMPSNLLREADALRVGPFSHGRVSEHMRAELDVVVLVQPRIGLSGYVLEHVIDVLLRERLAIPILHSRWRRS